MNTEVDLGISELDKLIHSYEFENQQYVKMIDKENQLIDALQTQICNKSEQVSRLEVEISRFDEDTKRLHRQYTNNCDNIRSLRNTIDVMSAHETTLSKQLEAIRAKTDQDCKYFQSQVSNYTNIKDDYMKKYKSFPLAIELDHRKAEVAEAQGNVDRLAAARKELEEKISLKEDELDGKIMSRIIIKMAETKLATHQLEKEIHQCLTEKTSLLEKLRELQVSKQPEQVHELFASHNEEENIEEQSMETDNEDNTMCMQDTEDEPQNDREPTEDFASLSISDTDEGFSVGSSGVQCGDGPLSPTTAYQDYPSSETAEDHTDNLICEDIKNDSSVSPSILALGASYVQHVRAYDLSQDMGKDSGFEDAPMNQVQMTTISQQSPMDTRTSESSGQATVSKTHLHEVSTTLFSSASTQLPMPKLGKVSPISGASKESEDDNNVQKPPSLRIPKLTVPQPPRIKPPPASVRPLLLPIPQAMTPNISVQIKQPPSPTLLVSKRKPNLLQIPRPPQQFHQQVKPSSLQPSETPEKRETQHKLQSPPSGDQEVIKVSASADLHESFTSGKNARPEKDIHAITGEKSVPQVKVSPNQQVHGPPVPSGQAVDSKEQNPLGPCAEVGISRTIECASDPPTFKLNRPVNDTPDQRTVTKGGTSMTNQAETKAVSANSSFSLGTIFDNFDKETTTADEDEEGPAVPSIFNLFNMSQNPSSCHSEGNPTNETSSFFNFGKFTDGAASPSSDEGPSNLLNLFMKSSGSQYSNGGFAVNLGTDDSQSREGEEDGGPAFTLESAGKSKGFLAFSKNSSSDEEGDQPLFKLF